MESSSSETENSPATQPQLAAAAAAAAEPKQTPAPAPPQQRPTPPKPPTNPKYYVNASYYKLHGELYCKVFPLIVEKGLFFNSAAAREAPPFKLVPKQALNKIIDFKLPETPQASNVLYKYLVQILEYSPHRSHPFYMGAQAGLDPYSIAGEFVAGVLATIVLTYLEAPVYTLMEEQVFRSLRQLIGYTDYSHAVGYGCVCPTLVFGVAMVIKLAIQRKLPKERSSGILGAGINNSTTRLTLFVNAESVHLWKMAAKIAVTGEDSVVAIPVDGTGRISIAQLEIAHRDAISKGYTPFMVVGVIGSDHIGAVDPLDEIGGFCQENGLWFHCHAGTPPGGLIFSDKLKKEYLAGVERSDSFLLNCAHALTVPSDCIVLVTKEYGLIEARFGVKVREIYDSENLYHSVWNNGDRNIQTSRRPEIVKLWFCWKANGQNGLSRGFEYLQELMTSLMYKLAAKGDAFYVVNKGVPTAQEAVFYYIPKGSGGRGQTPGQHLMNPQMKNLSHKIREKLIQDGKLVLGSLSMANLPACLSLTLTNAAVTNEDLDYVIELIEFYGEEVFNKAQRDLAEQKSEVAITNDDDESEIFEESWELSETEEGEPLEIMPPDGAAASSEFRASAPNIPAPPSTYIRSVNAPIEAFHQKFFAKLLNLLQDKGIYFQDHRQDRGPCNFRTPEQLLAQFDFSLNPEPLYNDEDSLLKIVEACIYYGIHQSHPYFVFREHASGLDPYSIMGDMFISITAPLSNTYNENPPYWFMEKYIIEELSKFAGYNPKTSFGAFCPGGSIAGMTAVYMAKEEKTKALMAEGQSSSSGKQLQLFVSESGHWLFVKGANLFGLGTSNVIHVKSNVDGKMSIPALKKALTKSTKAGHVPFMVVATAGTTVFGVFDNIEEISALCKSFNCWLHIDGSKGGALILAQNPKLRAYMAGVEKSDSMNFNAHKFFGNVQLNGILLVKRSRKFMKQEVGQVFGGMAATGGDYPPNSIEDFI